MKIKHIEKCVNPPAYFKEPVFRVTMGDEYGSITQYIPAHTQHEAEIKANKECAQYMKRQRISGSWRSKSLTAFE